MNASQEIVVDSPDSLDACCKHLSQCATIGLDTEFVGEQSYHPELCLVQIATEAAIYLVDPFAFEKLDSLWNILVDPSRTIVVHAGREEVRLCHLACGKSPANLVDLQIAAGLVGYAYPLGHGPLIMNVLGIKIKKGETLTEWRRRPLSPSQMHYAFDDVRYLLPVWEKLERKMIDLNRQTWAMEEFARLREQSIPEAPTIESLGEKWRKLKGLGGLDRKKLAMVRELYQWREEKALAWDRPARVIVRDDLLVEIAHRQPKSAQDLSVIRGLAHKFLDELFAVFQHVQTMSVDSYPIYTEKEQDSMPVTLAIGLLTAVLPDFAARNQIAPNLVSTNAELRRLVRAFVDGDVGKADLQLARGWRSEAVLPHFLALLEGKRGLRIADIRSATPLEYRDF